MADPEEEIKLRTRRAVLSDELEGEPPFRIHGVALGPGDVTYGKHGKKKWPAETLKKVAATLEGRTLVRDHINSTLGNVGEVVKSFYKEGTGVLFEAELDDRDLAEKINRGRLEVSARIKHLPESELEEDEETGATIIEPPVKSDNLSIVNSGASPSNQVDIGEAAMSDAELQAEFGIEDDAEVAELATHTPEYSEVATGRSWDGLNMEDFDTDDLSEIDDHFIVSDSGFPPENFGDLGYEVVDTDGALVREAVNSAWGLRGQTEEDIENILLDLNEAFDDPPIDTEESENEESDGDDDEAEVAETEEEQSESDTVSVKVDDPKIRARIVDAGELSKHYKVNLD